MSRAGQSVRDGHVFLPPPLLLLLAVAPYLGASRRFPRNVAVVDRREKNRAGGRCSLSAPDTQSHPCTAVPRIGTQNSPGPAFALVHMLRGESEVRPSRHEQPQILSCARIRRYLRAWTSHSICAHMADCACVCTPAEKPARLATPKLRCGSTSITLQVTGYESQPWQHRVAWGALGQLMKPRSLRCRGIPQGEPRTRSSKASAIGPRLHCMRLMSNRYHPPDDLGWHGGWRELAASRIQWDRPSGQGAAAELCGSCPPPPISACQVPGTAIAQTGGLKRQVDRQPARFALHIGCIPVFLHLPPGVFYSPPRPRPRPSLVGHAACRRRAPIECGHFSSSCIRPDGQSVPSSQPPCPCPGMPGCCWLAVAKRATTEPRCLDAGCGCPFHPLASSYTASK